MGFESQVRSIVAGVRPSKQASSVPLPPGIRPLAIRHWPLWSTRMRWPHRPLTVGAGGRLVFASTV